MNPFVASTAGGTGFADALCVALAHSLWQGVLAASLFALIDRFVRPGPRVRYAAAYLLLLTPLVMSVVVFAGAYGAAVPSTIDFAGHLGLGEAAAGGAAALSAPAQGFSTAAAAPGAGWGTSAVAWIWVFGVVLLAARRVGGGLWMKRLLRNSTRPLVGEWLVRARSLASSVGLRRKIRFLLAAGESVPFTWGWLRPVVVVPATALTALPPEQIELLLLHELVHLRRADFVMLSLQMAVETLFFYHPAVAWLGRQVRESRELACDAGVLAREGTDPLTYAQALLGLEQSREPKMALAATGGSLVRRVSTILDRKGQNLRLRAFVATLVASSALLLSIGVACVGHDEAPIEPAGATAAATAPAAKLDVAWLPPSVRRFESAILAAAAARGLDPKLVAVMVLVESGGDPTATSTLGAKGLMQLMPSTAKLVARRAKMEDFRTERLVDPKLNLALGTHLMRRLLDGHQGSGAKRRALALASYHAGSRVVRDHLRNGTALPEATQRYVRLVESLLGEAGAKRSPAYDAWRAKARQRVRADLVDPLPTGKLTSAFGTRRNPFSGRLDFHRGVDMKERPGRPVRAVLGGRVVAAKLGGDRRGEFVRIRHRLGLDSRYYHLGSIAVRPGDVVRAGQVIGTVGSSGKVTGAHLHFELRDHGSPIDPLSLLRPSKK